MPGRAERCGQPVDVVLAPGKDLQQRKDGAAGVGKVGPLERPAAEHERVAVTVDRHGLQPRKYGHRHLRGGQAGLVDGSGRPAEPAAPCPQTCSGSGEFVLAQVAERRLDALDPHDSDLHVVTSSRKSQGLWALGEAATAARPEGNLLGAAARCSRGMNRGMTRDALEEGRP
jgi:hypothetical protein